jgi:hypothetical protein
VVPGLTKHSSAFNSVPVLKITMDNRFSPELAENNHGGTCGSNWFTDGV